MKHTILAPQPKQIWRWNISILLARDTCNQVEYSKSDILEDESEIVMWCGEPLHKFIFSSI